MKKRAFTIVELVVAMFVMSFALLSMLWMTSYSNRGSMDTYYEFLAFSLAKEPVEVFRAFGYKWLCDYSNHPILKYQIGVGWQEISDETGGIQHPFDAALFERAITISDASYSGVGAKKIVVKVRPKKLSRVDAWLSRDEVSLEALIVEGPK